MDSFTEQTSRQKRRYPRISLPKGMSVAGTQGYMGVAPALSETVFSDTTSPSVSITAPVSGATVAGTITVAASATDDLRVAGVQFKIDGANLGAEITATPYAIAWDTATVSNAVHTLTAVARDAAGNPSASSAVAVRVRNHR